MRMNYESIGVDACNRQERYLPIDTTGNLNGPRQNSLRSLIASVAIVAASVVVVVAAASHTESRASTTTLSAEFAELDAAVLNNNNNLFDEEVLLLLTLSATADEDFLAIDVEANVPSGTVFDEDGEVCFVYTRSSGNGLTIASAWGPVPAMSEDDVTINVRLLRVTRDTEYTVHLYYRSSSDVADEDAQRLTTVDSVMTSSTACSEVSTATASVDPSTVEDFDLWGVAFHVDDYFAFYDNLGDVVWCLEIPSSDSAAYPTKIWYAMSSGEAFAFAVEGTDGIWAQVIDISDGSIQTELENSVVLSALAAAADDLTIAQSIDDLTIDVTHELIRDPWVADGSDDIFYTFVRYVGAGLAYNVAAILSWTPATGAARIVGGITTYDIFPEPSTESDDTSDHDHCNAISPTLVKDQWLIHDRSRSDIALVDISDTDHAEVRKCSGIFPPRILLLRTLLFSTTMLSGRAGTTL